MNGKMDYKTFLSLPNLNGRFPFGVAETSPFSQDGYLSPKQIQEKCKVGQGQDECRYFAFQNGKSACPICLKLDPASKAIVDQEVKLYLEKNENDNEEMPLGEGCEFYRYTGIVSVPVTK